MSELIASSPAVATSQGDDEDFGRMRRRRRSTFSVLFNRGTGLIGVAGIVAGVLMPTGGLGFQACMLHKMSGLPCPGCGLTRSVTNILHGNFELAWAYNPFGYLFAGVFVVLAAGLFVPRGLVRRWEEEPPISDRAMGVVTGVLILCMMVFGFARMWSLKDLPRHTAWWEMHRDSPASAQP